MRSFVRWMSLGLVLSGAAWPRVGPAEIPQAAAEQASGAVDLRVQGERFSAKIQAAPLQKVMEELARQIPLKVDFTGNVGAQKVTLGFEGLPLEEGVKRILVDTSYTLSYSGSAGARRTMEIKVATSDSGAPGSAVAAVASPSPEREKERQALIDKALRSPDSKERLAALQALQAKFPMEEILPTITAALKDKDKDIRRFALSALGDAKVPIEPVAELIQQSEDDPMTQITAMTYLFRSYRGESANTLYRVVEDPTKHKAIRKQARRMLDRIEGKIKVEEPLPEESSYSEEESGRADNL